MKHLLATYVWCQCCGTVHDAVVPEDERVLLDCYNDTDDPDGAGYYVRLYTSELVADSLALPPRMKVWGGTFDGRKRLTVMARTQADAARAFGISTYLLRQYGGATSNITEIEAHILAGEGVVLERKGSAPDHEPFRKADPKR